jgi:hypothetical protein
MPSLHLQWRGLTRRHPRRQGLPLRQRVRCFDFGRRPCTGTSCSPLTDEWGLRCGGGSRCASVAVRRRARCVGMRPTRRVARAEVHPALHGPVPFRTEGCSTPASVLPRWTRWSGRCYWKDMQTRCWPCCRPRATRTTPAIPNWLGCADSTAAERQSQLGCGNLRVRLRPNLADCRRGQSPIELRTGTGPDGIEWPKRQDERLVGRASVHRNRLR